MRPPWILLLVLLLGGCSAAALEVLGALDTRPTGSVTRVRIQDVGLRALTLGFEVEVDNPYTFDLPLAGLGFALHSDGHEFLSGSTEVGGTVPARGTRTLSVPVAVDYQGLYGLARQVRPGQIVPYTASLRLESTVGETPVTIPASYSGELPVPSPPSIRVASLDWTRISLDAVRGNLELAVENTNEFPFSVQALDYQLSLGGGRVAEGENRPDLGVAPGATGVLTLPLSFSPGNAGLALVNLLKGDETAYEIAGSLSLDTPFGPMELPFSQDGKTRQSN